MSISPVTTSPALRTPVSRPVSDTAPSAAVSRPAADKVELSPLAKELSGDALTAFTQALSAEKQRELAGMVEAGQVTAQDVKGYLTASVKSSRFIKEREDAIAAGNIDGMERAQRFHRSMTSDPEYKRLMARMETEGVTMDHFKETAALREKHSQLTGYNGEAADLKLTWGDNSEEAISRVVASSEERGGLYAVNLTGFRPGEGFAAKITELLRAGSL